MTQYENTFIDSEVIAVSKITELGNTFSYSIYLRGGGILPISKLCTKEGDKAAFIISQLRVRELVVRNNRP